MKSVKKFDYRENGCDVIFVYFIFKSTQDASFKSISKYKKQNIDQNSVILEILDIPKARIWRRSWPLILQDEKKT